ncbi:MAG: HEAT repeat domain-containing protein [Phycisphaerae bacterium]
MPRAALLWIVAPGLAACAPSLRILSMPERNDLRREAMLSLTTAIQDSDPAIRVRAIEALEQVAPQTGRPFFRELLYDDHPAVRFAAMMAAGGLRYRDAQERIRKLADDENPHVRIGAIFALHRLGDTTRTSELAALLLTDPSPGVRGNAAVVLGRLGEPGAAALLGQALRDKTEAVRIQVLEAMVRLGDTSAENRLGLMGLNSSGQKMVVALLALRASSRPAIRQLFEEQFRSGVYDEVRLAAAAGLGRFGSDEGLAFAVDRLLHFMPSGRGADTREQETIRVMTLAAVALEDIDRPAALSALAETLHRPPHPTVRVAVARSILAITGTDRSLPVAMPGPTVNRPASGHPPTDPR